MRENVQITIQGVQHDISEDVMETAYIGKYRRLADKHIITYEEYFEENGTVPSQNTNLIKIDTDSVQITKKGTVTTQMHFEENKKYCDVYQTPFGNFDMMLQTKKLTVHETGHTISVTIDYTLSLNGSLVSECTIQMEIIEEK